MAFAQAFQSVQSFALGIIILGVGFVVATYATNAVRDSPVLRGTGVEEIVAAATKVVLYFAVAVIGLETMGINVGILYTLAETVGLALALAFAISVGIALGFGGKDYVADRVDQWGSRSEESPADDD